MSDRKSELGLERVRQRLEHFSQRAVELSAGCRAVVDEILEAFSVSVEELHVAAEELDSQNQELLALRDDLEAERQRYLELFQFAPDGYLVTDPQGTIREANRAAVELLTVSATALHGKPLALYVSRGERDRFYLELKRLATEREASSDAIEWEFTVQPRNRPPFPAALTVAQIHGAGGELIGLRWLLRDVTASRRAAEQLRLMEEAGRRRAEQAAVNLEVANQLLRATIDNLPIGVIVSDAKGEVLHSNGTAEEILGSLSTGRLMDPERPYTLLQPDGSSLPPEERPAVRVLREGRPVHNVELLVRRGDGHECRILVSAAPLRNVAGELERGLTVFYDITEQRAMEAERERLRGELEQHANHLEEMVARRTAALRASEARLQAISDNAATGIGLVGDGGRLLSSNPALEAIVGYGAEELNRMTLADVTYPEDRESDGDLYRQLLDGVLDSYQIEKRWVRKDGQVRWVRLAMTRPEAGRASELWQSIATVDDITERKKAQEALLQAERLTLAGKLGASLAHEINNPLQAVIGCLGLAEEMLQEADPARRYLDIASGELERAARIVSQLRDMNRPPELRAAEATDLNVLVEQALVVSRRLCLDHDVAVEWSPAPTLPAVQLVPDRLQQVFLNLILNAVEAMRGGGVLSMSTLVTHEPEGVRVMFADTGKGIDPEMLPQLFEAFHTTRSEGLGLGLYVSQSIIQAHGGAIDVESTVGEGTTFTVWLPTHKRST